MNTTNSLVAILEKVKLRLQQSVAQLQLPEQDARDVWELSEVFVFGKDEEREEIIHEIQQILLGCEGVFQSIDLDREPDDDQKWLGPLSQRIRKARVKAGLTQVQLATKAGIPQSHVSRLETAKHSPSHKTLSRIAKALDVPLSQFDPSADQYNRETECF